MTDDLARNEIRHGRVLAACDTEGVWGWGTAAGRVRAGRRARLIAAAAMLAPDMRVMEVGCGTGMFTEMFSRSGARITAVDISRELLRKARGRNLPPERVRFLEKRFEECDVEGPFDAILGSSVLHHLDLVPSLTRMFALLRDDGLLSFAEPNYLNPQVFLERMFRFLPCFSYVSADETAFVRFALERRLRSIGFVDVRITPFDWLHPATPAGCIAPMERIGALAEFLPVLREFAGSLLITCRRPAGHP